VPDYWTIGASDPFDPRHPRSRAGLEESLRTAIRGRHLAPGSLLPSTRVLAQDLRISRGTVVAAYDQLVAEGYLTARRGAGTVVVDLGLATPTRHPAPAPVGPTLDLRPGRPDGAAFPVSAWLSSARAALLRSPPDVFGYGTPKGLPALRAELSGYLSRARGVYADPQQILITTGSTQSISLLGTALARQGRNTLAMEDPCFGFHRRVAALTGQSIVPVPVDDDGLIVERLGSGDARAATAVIVTPSHQFPTGVALHQRRRLELTTWARDTSALIIEDDYDGEFRYDRQPIGAVQGTAPDHVAYLGTASKTLGPGLRLGWMVLPRSVMDLVVDTKLYTDHSTEVISQLTMADLITSHRYERHIRRQRLRHRRRRDVLTAALAAMPSSPRPPRLNGIPAGAQALVLLPDHGPGEAELIALAARRGLSLEGINDHWHCADGRPQGLLIGITRPSDGSYPAAVSCLVEVLSLAYR
jgi:GntR family transcriptional regulator / MocR family aminotransferase